MTHAEFDDAIITMKINAEVARNAEDWSACTSICMKIAELTLDHPQFWPKHVDHDQLKRHCENIVTLGENALGMP